MSDYRMMTTMDRIREVLAVLAVGIAATLQSWRTPSSPEGQGET